TRGPFTFWDYQRQAWERDNDIRIEHLLLSPQAAELMRDGGVDGDQRATGKATDHVAGWGERAA
ncbi:exodeoxyribonuclease III, partial [Paracoccus sanguinis]